MLHRFFCIICTFLLLIISAGTACVAQQHSDIHAFIDNWHKAAAEAKADVFFGSMSQDCVYIGTDKTERWTKEQFMTFARPYFDKGKAWDFKPYDRDLHVTSDGKSAWFSELLTTWMGVCRGSGVLAKENGQWFFKQYHLSVTVPNDLIRDFITLVENFDRKVKP
ncbi:MAG: nuclear transport factor 2 family protein [Chryseolinea sp.]